MQLGLVMGRALEAASEAVMDADALKRYRIGTPDFDKAMGKARGILRLDRQSSKHLADFVATTLRAGPYVACIRCGSPIVAENKWMTRDPMTILVNAAKHVEKLAGLLRALRQLPLAEKVPMKDRTLRNGFCEPCVGRLGKHLPEEYRIVIEDPKAEPPLRPFDAGSVEEAVLFLHRNHVIFDEERFRIIWNRSVKIRV